MSHYDYERIAKAIDYLKINFRSQPELEEVAAYVHLSPYHFQRVFTHWAGVSPKKFLQYLSIEYAKDILKEKKATLFDVAHETGLSGTGRLHDLFITIEGMTPGEYKNGGVNLEIDYCFAPTPFGEAFVASTEKGICGMLFADNRKKTLEEFEGKFPRAKIRENKSHHHHTALNIFEEKSDIPGKITLHLRGTPFQLKVWDALLKIPAGKLTTYGKIARQLKNDKASRAVGSAVGENPVAYLIPCHRVIRSEGTFGQYHWGEIRKTAMIGREAAMISKEKEIRNFD